jgi:hypothetical protein
MKMKIFFSRTRKELQEAVNAFLEQNPVSPDSMRFEFSSIAVTTPIELIIEHTLVLFYVPMHSIR